MTEKTYTASEVKTMLGKSMIAFRASMISLIRECAVHEKYKDMGGQEALLKVASKLEELK